MAQQEAKFRQYEACSPAILYKYYRSVEYLKSSLSEGYIHLENPATYNDIFDSSISAHERELEYIGLNKEVLDYIIGEAPENSKDLIAGTDFTGVKNVKGVFLLLNSVIGVEESKSLQEKFLQKYCTNMQAINNKIACFSERNDSILMWSHYGDSLRGGCLCFDTSKDVALFGKAQKVQYTDLRSYQSNFNLYFTKASDWSYEQEWRIVVEQDSDKIHTPSIGGIIIGEKMPKDNQLSLGILATERKFSIYRAIADRDTFKIRIARTDMDELLSFQSKPERQTIVKYGYMGQL